VPVGIIRQVAKAILPGRNNMTKKQNSYLDHLRTKKRWKPFKERVSRDF
jgi:hypothetical protein